jgi:hypothetical protein
MGLALARAERVRAAPCTVMGAAQACCSGPRGADACTVVGRAESVRGARACSTCRTSTIVVGPGASRPVVGCAGDHLKACRAGALLGGACRGRTKRTAVCGSIVGSACSPVMGNVEERRARGASSAVVVRAIGCSAAASTSSATAARACCGPILVAARRVTRPA